MTRQFPQEHFLIIRIRETADQPRSFTIMRQAILDVVQWFGLDYSDVPLRADTDINPFGRSIVGYRTEVTSLFHRYFGEIPLGGDGATVRRMRAEDPERKRRQRLAHARRAQAVVDDYIENYGPLPDRPKRVQQVKPRVEQTFILCRHCGEKIVWREARGWGLWATPESPHGLVSYDADICPANGQDGHIPRPEDL